LLGFVFSFTSATQQHIVLSLCRIEYLVLHSAMWQAAEAAPGTAHLQDARLAVGLRGTADSDKV
jgi:hypothetical protein